MSSSVSDATDSHIEHDEVHHGWWATQSIFRPFPTPQTFRQWFYLLFLQGFGAGIIDFGCNFAIAYGMYAHQSDVRMWVFSKNTIAGDLGVTPIIQTAVSMLISSTLVHTDLHHNAIQPLPFVYPHVEHLPDPRDLFDRIFRRRHPSEQDEVDEKKRAYHNEQYGKHGIRYYYWMLVRFAFEGTEMNMIVAKCGPRNWALRLLWTAAQGALLGIIFGFPIFCLAITILGPIYGKGNMGGKWAPQAIKGVYGCIIGWVTNPVIAALALGSQADHHIVVVPVDAEAQAGDMNTIAEENEEELVPPSPLLSPGAALRQRGNTVSSQTSPRISPTRTRSNSVLSLRPPLSANVSYMPATPTTPRTPSSGPAALAPRSPMPTRPRGLTASSFVSTGTITSATATIPMSPGPPASASVSVQQYQYALGGHGGRAKRSRSNTTATLPNSAIIGLGRPGAVTPQDRDRSASSPAGSPRPASTLTPPAAPHATRSRTNSDVAGGLTHAMQVGHQPQQSPSLQRPSADVFGSGHAIPRVQVQRPSLDLAHPSHDVNTRRIPRSRSESEGPLGEHRDE